MSKYGVFLVLIFSYFDGIQRCPLEIFVFNPNTEIRIWTLEWLERFLIHWNLRAFQRSTLKFVNSLFLEFYRCKLSYKSTLWKFLTVSLSVYTTLFANLSYFTVQSSKHWSHVYSTKKAQYLFKPLNIS